MSSKPAIIFTLKSTFLHLWFKLLCLTYFFSVTTCFLFSLILPCMRWNMIQRGKAFITLNMTYHLLIPTQQMDHPVLLKVLLSFNLMLRNGAPNNLFNVPGLNHPAKRSSVWKEALKLHSDILCIQETHFLTSNPPTFQHRKFHHIFLASAPQKKRGSSYRHQRFRRLCP